MFLFSEPEIPLRLQNNRAVLNGVLVDEADIATGHNFSSLLEYARSLSKGISPGDVETSFFHFGEHIRDDLEQASNEVHARLAGYGLVFDYNTHEVLGNMQVMATRGAVPHSDGYNPDWHEALFWIYVLHSHDADLWFGNLGLRVPLQQGQLIVFDPGQPHAVVAEGQTDFRKDEFPASKKQFYLCGHLSYDADFWRDIGVACSPSELSKLRAVDITECTVDTRTTRVKVPRPNKH